MPTFGQHEAGQRLHLSGVGGLYALKADQIPKVQEINLKYAQKMDPVLKGSEGPLVKMRAAKAIDQDKEAELSKVLTQEQYKQYLASKQEMREQLEQRIQEKRQGEAH